MLTCTKCGSEKLPEAFPFDKKKRSGRSSWCRICLSALQERRRKAQRAAARARRPPRSAEELASARALILARRRELHRLYSAAYRKTERGKAVHRAWRARNREKIRLYCAHYYHTRRKPRLAK